MTNPNLDHVDQPDTAPMTSESLPAISAAEPSVQPVEAATALAACTLDSTPTSVQQTVFADGAARVTDQAVLHPMELASRLANRNAPTEEESEDGGSSSSNSNGSFRSAVISTLLSLLVVLVLLLAVRLVVPSMVEEIRYSWMRGQLRAEHEISGDALQNVSLGGIDKVSQLIGQQVGPAVVHINVQQARESLDSKLREFMRDNSGEDGDPWYALGQGSGVIVDTDGYILTNNHVIEPGGEIDVFLSDGRRLPARIVGTDPVTDLALLKVESKSLLPIQWGDAEAMEVGSLVWAAGSPFGLKSSFTLGILSGKHRTNLSGNRYRELASESGVYRDLMQSDVAVNPGNSGGPLVNAQGQLIGINTAIVGESYRGISFAIPSTVARTVYERLKQEGEFQRGWLGVRLANAFEEDVEDGSRKQIDGALVEMIIGGGKSPAGQAGIQAGDRITRFNGVEVKDTSGLIRQIGDSRIGESVEVELIRAGKPLKLEVKVDARPDQFQLQNRSAPKL